MNFTVDTLQPTRAEGKDLSVIIVNWNTCDLLDRCLQSVYNTVQAPKFEVLVVDNASTDGSVAMVREQFPQIRLIANQENVGFARANNQAIRESKGQYVLLLNSDAELLPRTVERLVSFANTNPQVAIVGSQWLNPDGTFQASFNDFPSLLSECVLLWGLAHWIYTPYFPSHPPEQSQKITECDWVGGACLLARMTAIEQVGLLDECYFMYVEETDWCFRMKHAGWRVFYLPEARVLHHGGQSASRSSATQQALLYRSKMQFFLKHHGQWQARGFLLAVRLAALFKSGYWLVRGMLTRDRHSFACERARAHWSVAWTGDL